MTVRAFSAMFIAALLSIAPLADADEPKFRPRSEAPAAFGRYRVTLALTAGEDADLVVPQLLATVRGQTEPYAEEGFTGFVIVTTEASARLLSTDPRVALVEELPALQPASGEAAAEAAAPLRHAPPPPRTVQANETGSTWSIGTYTYDGSGNIKSIGRGDGTSDTYVYDAFGRLTSGTAGSGRKQEYTYDAFGNILTITTDGDTANQTKLGVDPATNRISRASDPETGDPYNAYGTFDGAGNMLSTVTGDSFTYDGLGMLKESTVGGARKVYLYTPDEERIASVAIVNNARADTVWTLRDADGAVLRRYYQSSSGTWSWSEDYIYAGSQLLAAEVNAPEKTLHFFLDHLGSPRLITGNGGAEFARRTYYPFGRETAPSSTDYESMGFTGHEEDAPSLTYMHARSYLPMWGRFLSPDPVGGDPAQIRTWNRYSYVTNSPMIYIDPRGLVETLFFCNDRGCYQEVTESGLTMEEQERRAQEAADEFMSRLLNDENASWRKQFVGGMKSYFVGIGRAARFGLRYAGAYGEAEHEAAKVEQQYISELSSCIANTACRQELSRQVLNVAAQYPGSISARTTGRALTALTVTRLIGQLNPKAGAAAALLGPVAAFGDAAYSAERLRLTGGPNRARNMAIAILTGSGE